MKKVLIALLLCALSFAQAQTYVQLILDASGSMWNRLEDGTYRITAAKQVLADFIRGLPSGDLNVGLRVYGSRVAALDDGSCEDTELFVPMTGVDKPGLQAVVDEVTATGATPIALSLQRAAQDFPADASERVIILVTDGEESCGGDLRAVADELNAQGFDVDIKIIGFALDATAEESFQGIGEFVAASDAEELASALEGAVETVIDEIPSAGLNLWLRADVGVEQSAGVSRWLDQSGSANDAVPLSEEAAPVLEAAAIGSQPALRFDGENDMLVSPLNINADVIPQMTVFTVFESDTAETRPFRKLYGHDDGSFDRAVGLDSRSDLPFGLFTGQGFEATFALVENTAYILSDVYDADTTGAGSYTSFVNGSETAQHAVQHGSGLDDFFIGGTGTSFNEFWLGKIAEVIVYNRVLDEPERQAVEAYLAAKYAIDLSATARGAVTLNAAATTAAGQALQIAYEGDVQPDDYITIATPDMPDGTYIDFAYVDAEGLTPISVTAPFEAGNYEIRYLDDRRGADDPVLARVPLVVEASDITLSFPSEVLLGSEFNVEWTGPAGEEDYITIVPAGAPEGTYTSYFYLDKTNVLTAPSVPGQYEVRYTTDRPAEKGTTFYSQPITVLPANYSLTAPDAVMAGTTFEVSWSGPEGADDYITIVPAGAAEGEYTSYFYLTAGNPGTLVAPSEAGSYEIRYTTDRQGAKGTNFFNIPITVTDMQISLTAPSEVGAGQSFDVTWEGPDGPQDYITIVPVGAAEGSYLSYVYLRGSNPVTLTAPDEAGSYEIRYTTDRGSDKGRTFFSIPISVK